MVPTRGGCAYNVATSRVWRTCKNGIHHVAYTCHDLQETHHFYHELLELPLVNIETEENRDGSWFKHVFYEFDAGTCIAFFRLEGFEEPAPLRTAVSTDFGLPLWANHVAIRLDAERASRMSSRLKSAGCTKAMDVDHGWCQSRYYVDPNGILIGLCVDTPGMPRSENLRLDDDAAVPTELADSAS